MADLARIKRNVSKMAAQNAPAEDIDGYIASEGVSLDDVRNFRPGGDPNAGLAYGQPPEGMVLNPATGQMEDLRSEANRDGDPDRKHVSAIGAASVAMRWEPLRR